MRFHCAHTVQSVLAILMMAWAAPAFAHRINLFATAQGGVIEGECYFSGGGRPGGAKIEALDATGRKLGECVTDAQGRFRFQARERTDHRLVLTTGDGHGAEYTVKAEELAGLPEPANVAQPSPAAIPWQAGAPAPHTEEAAPALHAETQDEFDRRISAAVAREVRPLREQIARWQSQTRLRDVIGGLGWILGIAGAAFFALGRRRHGKG